MTKPGPEELTRLGRLAELGLLSASLLHELRQPLLAIQATAEMVVARGSEDEAKWRKVLDQLAHIRALLDAYAGGGRPDGPVVRLDLRHPADAAVATLRPRARQARVTVETSLPDTPLPVRGRGPAIRQILVNLVHNAVDASEGATPPVVLVRGAQEGDRCVVEVLDEGPGLRGDPERLFQPFVSHKAEGRGTGLGLHIARTLARDAGGDVTLSDRGDGRGAIARLWLPRGSTSAS